MALPNGDLITTVFDPQMAYPVDKRMQVDTLNSRDSISMFIRWEGMTVYVLEDSKIYILQGGRSNEYWKELGLGSGTGGTTFVGQFENSALLPATGRSAGDYAFVGTGDDFVQYNWDNISGQWVMAEGQTDMASEFFHIGYKTPLRRPVIFPLFPKDVLVETSGDFVFAPATAVARFIFTGEVDAIRGVEYATADREIKLVNRTGSDIPIRDKASGIPSGSGFDFGGTDYVWVNGSEITLKGYGTYWQLAPNNQIAFSDHLDSVNAQVSVGSDGLKVWTGFIDNVTKVPITFKQLSYVPDVVDGRIFRQINGEYFGDAEFLERREFNILKFGGDNSGVNFSDNALNLIKLLMRDGDKIVFPHGTYKFQDIQTFNQSVEIDFGNSNITVDGRDGFIFEGVEKSTHTVTANYVEGSGSNYLTLNNTTGIQKGDLINIISTELYDSSRISYWKGGNFLVIGVVGDMVFFDRTMPFNMSASSITVKIYNPLKVKLTNIGSLTNTRALANTLYGIRLLHCADSSITGFNTDNFKYNVDVYRSVDITLSSGSTGIAKTDGAANYDGYGVALESSTRVILNNVKTQSGQHGLTTGGREVCYDFTFNDCVFKSELEDWYGFGAHANLYNATFNSCTSFGFLGTGNITYNDGDIYSFVRGNRTSGALGVSDDPRYTSFTFNNVRIESFFSTTDIAQVMTSTRKHCRAIIFNNCPKVHIRLDIARRSEIGKFAEVGVLEINDCEDLMVWHSDNINVLKINNCIKDRNDRAITPYVTNGVDPRINQVEIDGLTLVGSSIGLRILNAGRVEMNRIICPTGDSSTTYPIELFDVENAVITNSDTSGAPRGINFSGEIGYLELDNVKMSFLDASDFNNITSVPSYLRTNNFVSNLDGLSYNFITSTDGVKRNQSWLGSRQYNGNFEIAYHYLQIDRPNRNYAPDLTWLFRYNRMSYSAGLSTILTINANVFSENDELKFEIEGDGRSVSAGSGMTLRTPAGQGLFAPTGSIVTIRFKSATDALVAIIKPYTSPNASTTERGIIEQATDAETITGTDAERAVSPANLQAKLNSLILSTTATLNFPVIAIGDTATLTATVTGSALLDPVVVSAPASVYNANNSTVDAWVSAANTVTVRIRNNGESSIDPEEGQFKIRVFK